MLDSRDQLLRKLRLGEDRFLECTEMVFAGGKVKGPACSDLADELAAFANAHGGVLVLGVEDKSREIVGIPGDRLDFAVRYVSDVAQDSIRPPLDPVIERLELAKVMLPLGQSFNLGGLICDVLIDAAERIDVSKLPAHRRLALRGAISYAKSVGEDPE